MNRVYLLTGLLIFASMAVVGILPLTTPIASAQDVEIQDCADKVQWALDATEQLCVDIGDNKICYGHIFVDAETQSEDEQLDFDSAGDIADLLDVRTIRLSPMNLENELWGVAVMSLIAHQRYASPKPVVFLLFGDVDVENAVDSTTTVLEVTVANTDKEYLNVRLAPTLSAGTLGVLEPGQTVFANGRLADNSWLRVTLPDSSRVGWVKAEFLNSEDDINQLDIIERDASYYGPMQAFYFNSGINDAVCPESPESGMLVQTQEGVAEVTLLVNEVDITLTGTAFMQAEEEGDMTIGILSGWAEVESGGQSQTVYAGTQVGVSIAGDHPGAPGSLEPLEIDSLGNTLLTQISETTSITQPLSYGEINDILNPPTPEPEVVIDASDEVLAATGDAQNTDQFVGTTAPSDSGSSSSSSSSSSSDSSSSSSDSGSSDSGSSDSSDSSDSSSSSDKNNGVGGGTGGGKDNNRGSN